MFLQNQALSKPGPRNPFPPAQGHPNFVAVGPEGIQNLKIIQVNLSARLEIILAFAATIFILKLYF